MIEKIVRPQAEPGKISHRDEFELCYIRHQYFRKVEYNPTKEEMSPYIKIVEYIARKTFYTYRYLFHMIGMELDDIVSIGQIHLVNFIGLFEFDSSKNVEKYNKFINDFGDREKTLGQIPEGKDILSKNKANFTIFLKQRMEDLIRICNQKAKNIKGFKVGDIVPFYGLVEPPQEFYKLLEDNEAYGFKKSDISEFRAIRKRVKPRPKDGEPFKWSMWWYVAVPLRHRNLTVLDLSGAGLDPYESFHNLDPETILERQESEIRFDKNRKMFKNKPKEDRVTIINTFVEKNEKNPKFWEEVKIAKRLLKSMGAEYVGQNVI